MGLFENIGDLLSGLGSAAGKVAGTYIGTKEQYKYQSRLQQQQQSWLESMSSTAHQREVADLRNAGLNPILSVMGGSGASTPSSGMGQINAPDYGSSIRDGITTALQIKQTNANTNLQNQQAKTEEAKRDNFNADTNLKNVQKIGQMIHNSNLPEKYKKDFEEIESRAFLNYATASANEIQARAAQKNADSNRMNAETNKLNSKVNIAKTIGTAIGAGAMGAIGLGKGGITIKAIKNLVKRNLIKR